MLDLGGAPEPRLGEGSRLEQLVEQLEAERAELDALAAEGDVRAEAQAALRRLAAALLEVGVDRPGHAVAGLTLVNALAEADALIAAGDGEAGDAVAVFIAGEAGVDAFDLMAEAGGLDRFLRDALAMLVRQTDGAPAGCGWGGPDARRDAASLAAEVEEAMSRLAEAGLVDGGSGMSEVVDVLRAASEWRAYRPSAARVGRLALGALEAAERAGEIDPEAGRAVAQLAIEAGAGTLSPELRERAVAQLVRLGEAARLFGLAQGIEDDAARGEVLSRLLEVAQGRREADGPFLELALELAGARGRVAEERTLVRQARPAQRALLVAMRESETALLGALRRVLDGQVGPSDPGVASAVAAHGRIAADLRGLEALSAALAGDGGGREPPVRAGARPRAERLLEVGRRMIGSDGEALALLREEVEAAALLGRLAPHPGLQAVDESLRDAAVAWIQSHRSAWEEGGTIDASTLHAMARALDGAADVALVGRMARGEPSVLVAWPGFEASPRALGVLAAGAAEQAGETVRLAAAGEWARVRERLAAFEDEHAAVRAIGAAERVLRAGGCEGRAPGDSRGALLELVEGAPLGVGGPLVRSRRELAEMARYLEELPAAREGGQPASERAIRRYLADRAGAVLERVAGH